MKKGTGTLKREFNLVIDEVELLIFLSKKSDFLDFKG